MSDNGHTGQEKLVEIKALRMWFPIFRGILQKHVADVKAVDTINFHVYRGETFGLVGESGCGKSTTGRAILQLYDQPPVRSSSRARTLPSSGRRLHHMRRQLQMIFQDPYASLNPRMTVGRDHRRADGDARPRHRAERNKRVHELLDGGAQPATSSTATRTSSPAGSASASASPAPWRSSPTSSSATSRSRRWTSPSRRRSSTCWKTCRSSSG